MKVVVLAGGRGIRLWPYSRHSLPKQFLRFKDKYSLLQKTVLRFKPLVDFSDILIVTQQSYVHLVESQLQEIHASACRILIEPEKKNTLAAIALAMSVMIKEGCDTKEEMLVSSSDHLISPEKEFLHKIAEARTHAQAGKNVLFGIFPTKPETGYGYIKAAADGHVIQFVEKPDSESAKQYVLSGEYLWNSGIFLFQLGALLKEIKEYSPYLGGKIEHLQDLKEHFSELPDISIDHALLEKSQNTVVVALNVSWSDVGSWDGVYDILEKDENNNVKIGNVCDMHTRNCLIMGNKRLISTIGLQDMIIIETEDALLIGKKGESQNVKQIVEELQERNIYHPLQDMTSHRPWGFFTVLEEGDRYKIKRIVVEPLQKLSLQMHYHRSEHWVVVKGAAKVTIGEQEKLIHENESVFVPKSSVHRLENPGKVPLELIEVQVGEYVGEDDIVRFEDEYHRA